jgi:hypothetical protein
MRSVEEARAVVVFAVAAAAAPVRGRLSRAGWLGAPDSLWRDRRQGLMFQHERRADARAAGRMCR